MQTFRRAYTVCNHIMIWRFRVTSRVFLNFLDASHTLTHRRGIINIVWCAVSRPSFVACPMSRRRGDLLVRIPLTVYRLRRSENLSSRSGRGGSVSTGVVEFSPEKRTNKSLQVKRHCQAIVFRCPNTTRFSTFNTPTAPSSGYRIIQSNDR